MNRLRPVFFLSISILTFLGGCASQRFGRDFEPVDQKLTVELNPWFQDSTASFVYKTDLAVYGRNISGLSVFKRDGDSWRVALINEMGMKFFECNIYENAPAKYSYIASYLDKKKVKWLFDVYFKTILYTKKEGYTLSGLDADTDNILFKKEKLKVIADERGTPMKKITPYGMGNFVLTEFDGGQHPAPLHITQSNRNERIKMVLNKLDY